MASTTTATATVASQSASLNTSQATSMMQSSTSMGRHRWTCLSQVPSWSERLELHETFEPHNRPHRSTTLTSSVSVNLKQETSVSTTPSLPKLTHPKPVFPVNSQLNQTIALWHGDLLRLDVQAMAHPTNERFERCTALTNQLYDRAGAQLRRTLFTRLVTVRTGEVKLTRGAAYRNEHRGHSAIRPQNIIHTATPVYQARYRSAAETALFRCYENVLLLARQCNLRTLALPPLAIRPFGYPPEEAAHLGLRVLRRFLESHPAAFEVVVLVTSNRRDYHLYASLLPLYFPRDEAEAKLQCTGLPVNLGGPLRGEPLRPERAIRIKESPFAGVAATDGRAFHTKSSNSFQSSGSEEWSSSASSGSSSSSVSNSSYNSSEEDEVELVEEPASSLLLLSSKSLGKFARMQEECRDDKFKASSEVHVHNRKNKSSKMTNSQSSRSHSDEEEEDRSRSKSMLSVGRALVDCEQHLSVASSLNHHHHHHARPNHHGSCTHHRDAHLALEFERQLRRERLHRKVQLSQQQQNPAEKEAAAARLEHLKTCIYLEDEPDQDERKVLTVVGSRFTAETMADEVTLSYVLGQLDEAVSSSSSSSSSSSYVIVYYHDHVTEANVPRSAFIEQLTSLLSHRARKRLQAVYIVHPKILSRLYLWYLKTFHFPMLKEKVTFVRRLSQLQVS